MEQYSEVGAAKVVLTGAMGIHTGEVLSHKVEILFHLVLIDFEKNQIY